MQTSIEAEISVNFLWIIIGTSMNPIYITSYFTTHIQSESNGKLVITLWIAHIIISVRLTAFFLLHYHATNIFIHIFLYITRNSEEKIIATVLYKETYVIFEHQNEGPHVQWSAPTKRRVCGCNGEAITATPITVNKRIGKIRSQ